MDSDDRIGTSHQTNPLEQTLGLNNPNDFLEDGTELGEVVFNEEQILDEVSREYLKFGFKKMAKQNDFILIEEIGDAFRHAGQNPSEDVVKDMIEKAKGLKKPNPDEMQGEEIENQLSYSDFLTIVHEYWYPIDEDRIHLEEAFDVLDPKRTAKLMVEDFTSLLRNCDWPEDEIELILAQVSCGDGYFLYDDLTKLLLTPVELTKKKSAKPKSNTIESEEFTYEIVIPQKYSLEIFPSYQINGFNQTFNLSLIKDERFLSPSFIIQYFNQNQTWINRDIKHCFYKGYVNRNYLSVVSICLCNGLFGTFIYDNVEYFIEPKYHQNGAPWNFEHLFYTHKDLSVSNARCPVDGKPYFEERYYPHYIRNKRQFNIDPMAKHVEILIAYDDSIKEFHSDIDIKSYILTLFNYVSHLYSDASIGNNIKIWAVKLIELGKDLSNYIKSTDDADDILKKFCKWQQDYNVPGTYDAAVLLTRIPLCNKRAKNLTDSKCDTLGLTELGAMCNLASNCAIVRDNGFATAFTIAHEIAHLFGIRHDNDKVCLNFNKEQNLMATSLIFNHNHYKWSNCSRYYFTRYLESNRYPCLNNIPDYKSLLFKDLNNEQKTRKLPGYFSDLDEQCRRAFGIHFEYCKGLSHGPKCIRLYCREIVSNSSSCITNHAHWSDGTLCSETRMEIKRCFRGQCRSTEDLKVINGNWGKWSTWSSCTRTCGSAVQKSQRFCDNPKPENGGQYCSGQSTRIRSCEDNPPCEDSLDTFRQRQCSIYNNRKIDPSLPNGVQFEPKYNVLSNERCKLICKVSNDRLERSFIFNDRVEDGTPCGREDETRDICINGICMPIGCDYKYGSNATEDICGICNGQNRTCKLINGQKRISNIGITNLVTIPLNTTRISITQISTEKDQYYLAVKYSNGTYILNGLNNLQLYNIKIRIGSSTLFYSGFESSNESILITGRLKFPLDIQLISMYQSSLLSTKVYWEYYTSLNKNDLVQSLDEYCNRPCQGLKQIKKCRIYEKEYDLIYCSIFKISFEYKNETCNNHCVLNWTMKYQQRCSTRCGNGYKYVLYQCTKISSSMEIIDEDICRKYVGEKPKNILSCIGDCTGTGWVYGDWGECHYNGDCIRKRSVECRNSSDLVVSNDYCVPEFIFNIERCAEVACEQSKWNFSRWSDCDCSSNRRRRDVSCIHNGKQVNDYKCLYEPKPDETISCSNECRTTPYWKTYLWQSCTATCSSYKGIRHRRVVCFYEGIIVQDDYCDRHLKPIEQEWCTINISCLRWFIGEWSSCSATCGQGQQQRKVYCNDLSRPWFRRSDSECRTVLGKNSKPNEQQNCSITECPYWKISSWSNCSGKCGLGKRYRRIECLHNGVKFDENYCLQINKEKPLTIEVCNQNFYCPNWVIGIWSKCSVTCGIGIQHRLVVCKNQNEVISSESCDDLDRPATIRQCHMSSCTNVIPTWMTSDWTQCDLQSCIQTRTVHCIDSINKRNLSISQCTQSQVQPLVTRICPISNCLEWHVAQWHGCPAECGLGIENGSGFSCFTRQMPIRRLNTSECESVEPQLVKPILKRICRRTCIAWRTNDWTEVKLLSTYIRYLYQTNKTRII